MAIEADIFARLTAHAGTTALVGTRVYPSIAPTGATLPHLVYTRITDSAVEAMQDSTGLRTAEFEIACYASSYTATQALTTQVQAALNRYSGTPSVHLIQEIVIESVDTDYDPDAERHYSDVIVTVWYEG